MLVAADVGNSGVKVGSFDGDSLDETARLASPGEGDLASLLRVRGEIDGIVAVSVNESALREFLRGPGRGAQVLGRDLPILVENRYHRPEEVGHDRLANAAAAHALAGGPAVAIDLGSAVTADVVSGRGAFLGGVIAAGRRSLIEGLSAAAPSLPRVQAGEPGPGVPRSTLDALRTGVVLGLVGLVDRLIEEAFAWIRDAEGEGDLPRVLITGGDAALVSGRLRREVQEVPDLTLRGVRILYDRAGGGSHSG